MNRKASMSPGHRANRRAKRADILHTIPSIKIELIPWPQNNKACTKNIAEELSKSHPNDRIIMDLPLLALKRYEIIKRPRGLGRVNQYGLITAARQLGMHVVAGSDNQPKGSPSLLHREVRHGRMLISRIMNVAKKANADNQERLLVLVDPHLLKMVETHLRGQRYNFEVNWANYPEAFRQKIVRLTTHFEQYRLHDRTINITRGQSKPPIISRRFLRGEIKNIAREIGTTQTAHALRYRPPRPRNR